MQKLVAQHLQGSQIQWDVGEDAYMGACQLGCGC